jgi:5'-deoxynucleotidase YfbR-like HD superfamily hydrolase
MSESKQPPVEAAMTTVSGVQFTPYDPNPGDVRLEDIAHGLGNLCRASGQAQFFYSVGLHSIYVSQDLAARGESRRRQLMGLLHDAQEAYISDLISPVKAHLEEYKRLEAGVEAAVWEAFDLAMPRRVSEDVFRAINKLLADLGIGLDAEAIEDEECSYDYSDLL